MKVRWVLSLMVLLTTLAAACSPAAAPLPPAATEAPAVARDEIKEVEAVAMATPQIMEVPVAAEAAAAAYPGPQAIVLPQPGQPAGRMIIKDGLMELLVQDTDVALERVTQLAADQGGYIVSSRVWMESEFKHAELRMGVPSLAFEDTLNRLRRLAVQVLNEQASGQDVSAEYNDLQSRLVNLEATAARVREFLKQAKTVEESLRINATLSDLEGQIEQVKGQMKFYENRAAYSTITVLLKPQMPTPTPTPPPTVTPTPTPPPGWNPAKTAASASKVMVSLMKSTIDVLIWAAFLLWPFALAALIAWAIYRRLRRKPSPPKPGPGPDSEQTP